MRTKGEKGYTKKTSKKEVKKKKIYFCHVGQNCPTCSAVGSIVKRDARNHISLGDGMAPLAHLDPEAFFPLECNSCNARFKKACESLLSRLRKILV